MTSLPLATATRTIFCSALAALISLSTAWAVTFELDIKELEKAQTSRKEPRKKAFSKKAPTGGHDTETVTDTGPLEGGRRYTVKQGDHIFKILMSELGLTNNEAERLIPHVAKLNNLKDIRKLSVGQTLLLPSKHQRMRKPKVAPQEQPTEAEVVTPAPTAPKAEAAVATKSAAEPLNDAALVEAKVEPAAPPPPEPVRPTADRFAPAQVRKIASATSEEMVLSLLEALKIKPERKRIVETNYGGSGGSILSLKVDVYFEEGGKRFIVNCTPKDQFNYTLLRLMEQEGYKVIQAERQDFRDIAGSLLSQLGRPHSYVVGNGRNEVGKGDMNGYLVGDGKAPDGQLFLAEPQLPGVESATLPKASGGNQP